MRKTHICVLVFGLLLVAPVGCLARTGGTENNKAVARQLFEVALNQDNWNVYNEIHSRISSPTPGRSRKIWLEI